MITFPVFITDLIYIGCATFIPPKYGKNMTEMLGIWLMVTGVYCMTIGLIGILQQ